MPRSLRSRIRENDVLTAGTEWSRVTWADWRVDSVMHSLANSIRKSFERKTPATERSTNALHSVLEVRYDWETFDFSWTAKGSSIPSLRPSSSLFFRSLTKLWCELWVLTDWHEFWRNMSEFERYLSQHLFYPLKGPGRFFRLGFRWKSVKFWAEKLFGLYLQNSWYSRKEPPKSSEIAVGTQLAGFSRYVSC